MKPIHQCFPPSKFALDVIHRSTLMSLNIIALNFTVNETHTHTYTHTHTHTQLANKH